MTVSVTPKTITISNGTANDGSIVNTMFSDCYTNDSTLASYINSNCALTTGPNSFNSTQTFTATPVSTKGIDLAQASEPTSPAVGEFWYSSTNNVFEGLVQAATISAATNASPIVVTTGSAHGLGTGQTVYISGVLGNTAANGSFTITVTGSTTFSLGGSTGNGAYTSGGTVSTIQSIKQGSPIASVSAISSDPTAKVTDKGKLYVCTSSFTFTLAAAVILGSAWYCYIRNDGTGVITIDPNASETVDGSSTIAVYPGEAFTIVCDGSNFKTVGRDAIPRSYDSGNQTITAAGALTLAHGLGIKPKLLRYLVVNTSAELGYSVGDEVDLGVQFGPSSGSYGVSIVADATNINVRFGSNAIVFLLLNKGTGAGVNMSPSNWKFIVRAYA